MSNDTVSPQEPRWPKPDLKQVLQVFEQSSRDRCGPEKRRVGRPATVAWSHLCLAIMHSFLHGRNVQLQVWRLLGSEQVGLLPRSG